MKKNPVYFFSMQQNHSIALCMRGLNINEGELKMRIITGLSDAVITF